MPPKKGQLVKRRKTENAGILVPNFWFETSEDEDNVLLLLLARKKRRSCPFHHSKMGVDIFQKIIAFIPSKKRLLKLYRMISKHKYQFRYAIHGESCEHFLLLVRLRQGDEIDNKSLGYVYFLLALTKNRQERIGLLKKSLEYRPADDEIHFRLAEAFFDIRDMENFEVWKQKFLNLPSRKEFSNIEFKQFSVNSAFYDKDYIRTLKELDEILPVEIDEYYDYSPRRHGFSFKMQVIKLKCLVKLERWKDAIKVGDEIEEMSTETSCMLMAKCYFYLGNIARAVDYASKAHLKSAGKNNRIALQLHQYVSISAKKIKPAKIKWFF